MQPLLHLFILTTTWIVSCSSNDNEIITHRHLQSLRDYSDKPCKAVLVNIQYAQDDLNDDSNMKEDSYLACEHPDGKVYKVKSADSAFIKEYFINGPYKSGDSIVSFGSDAMIDLEKAEIITSSNDEKPILSVMKDEHRNLFERNLQQSKTKGIYSVLVVKVVASNAAPSMTLAELSNAVFGSSGDPVNLVSQFNACSHGQLIFIADARGENNGAISVAVNKKASNNAEALMNAAYDILKNNLFANHIMFCMPTSAMTGVAYAGVNSYFSVYQNTWCASVSAQMHEIGHNLGLGHSSAFSQEYDDKSGMMGYSYEYFDSPQMCFNAAKTWQLGWFSQRHLEISASGTRSYSGDIADMTQDPTASGGVPIVVKMATGTNIDFFLIFNRAIGFNSGTQEGKNQVRIVQTSGGSGENYSESYEIASLSSNRSWTSTALFNKEKVTVRVNSISTVANVDICIGPCPIPTTAPTAAKSPVFCGNLATQFQGHTIFFSHFDESKQKRTCYKFEMFYKGKFASDDSDPSCSNTANFQETTVYSKTRTINDSSRIKMKFISGYKGDIKLRELENLNAGEMSLKTKAWNETEKTFRFVLKLPKC